MKWLALLVLCSGCSYQSLTVERQRVNRDSLASTYVGSPDPAQKDPPTGERLWIDYRVSPANFKENSVLTLRIIYNNFEEEKVAFPVKKKSGQFSYSLLGEKYQKTGGIFTYRADLEGADGVVIDSWVQQMWFDLL